MKPTSMIEAEQQAIELQAQLQALTITDQTSYDKAVEARVSAKAWLKEVGEFFDSMQKPAYEAYKKILDNRKTACEPVEKHLANLNRALIAFDDEQERLRREEQRRLEEIAFKEAEEKRLAEAAHLEQVGADAETIDAMLSAPVAVVERPIATPTYERSKAVIYRDNWQGEVTDLFALVKAVAKDKSKLNLLQINQPALNQLAKALKETMAIPGVRAVNNKVAASGRG